MQPVHASHQSAAHDTVPARTKTAPPPTVGPLGGIIFSALCLATYVAVVVVAMW